MPERSIRTEAEYRRAVAEAERLEGAKPHSPDYRRRQALLAALASFEQKQQDPALTPGKPAPFQVTKPDR